MTNIKISIIIPVYNVEKYIHQCLDSVLNQSLQEIEVICVDDESPDNCPQILDEYAQKDSRVKVIHKKNAGQGVARNTALDIAQGKYVFFLDSDDWLEDGALEKMYNKIEADEADVVLFNGYRYFEKTGTKNVFWYADAYYSKFKDKVFSSEEAKEVLYKPSAIPLKIYRHESIKKYKFRYTKHKHWEDHLPFFTFLAKARRISVLKECVYNYRQRESSSTFTAERCIKDCLDNFYMCCKAMESEEQTKKFFVEFLKYKISNFIFYYRISTFKGKRILYKDIQKAFRYINKNYSEELKEIKDLFLFFDKICKYPFWIYFLWTKLRRTCLFIKANQV